VRLPQAALLLLLLFVACGACDTGQSQSAAAPTPVLTVAPASLVPSISPITIPAGELPNSSLTPGETFGGVTADQVCASGYAGRARNVLREQYVQVYASYRLPYPEPAGTYELDHLVPLELGGDNSNRNLWPEPASPGPGFHQKDDLENYLHDAVCAGRMQLADAQSGIAANWLALYGKYMQP
jgi:hypothetical protein